MNKNFKRRPVLVRTLLVIAIGVVAQAQGAEPGSKPPPLHGETLDGKAIVLPDKCAGTVTLLLLGASKKGGERTGPWKDHFLADFGVNPRATYYVAALLQRVPAPFRHVIRASMRSGTAEAARGHVLTSASDEETWKNYLNMGDDSLPAVLLLDESGHVLHSHIGVFDPSEYEHLKTAAAAALAHK